MNLEPSYATVQPRPSRAGWVAGIILLAILGMFALGLAVRWDRYGPRWERLAVRFFDALYRDDPAARAQLAGSELVTLGWLLIIPVAAYLLPVIIAICRRHPHAVGILAVNVVLGSTVIGWLAAFIWACIMPRPSVIIVPETRVVVIHQGTDGQSISQGALPPNTLPPVGT